MKIPQLTLRDLFWLVLVSAVVVGWSLSHNRGANRIEGLTPIDVSYNKSSSANPSADSRSRNASIEKLSQLSDAQLTERLGELQVDRLFGGGWDYEPCLAEMARRGLGAELQEYYDELMSRERQDGLFHDNLELLTALRRAQGQPDPLKIHVELMRQDQDGNLNSIPLIRATIENVDVGQESVLLVEGGEQFSNRLERWRVHLTDGKGRRIPDATITSWGTGGSLGFATMGPLENGKKGTQENWLDARCYVQPPPPGKYRLQVFHSQRWIADKSSLAGLIVVESEPVTVIVENPDVKELQMSLIPPVAILAMAGIAVATLGIRRFLAKHSAVQHRVPTVRWRDLAWLVLVAVLALGWLVDNKYLAKEAWRLQPHQDANWTMRLAE